MGPRVKYTLAAIKAVEQASLALVLCLCGPLCLFQNLLGLRKQRK